MSPRRSRSERAPEQLPLETPATKANAKGPSPDEEARVALARRAKFSAVPGHLRLVFTLDLPREVAEQLVARAIREGKNLDALVAELLAEGAR